MRTTCWRLAAKRWAFYVRTRIDTTHDYDGEKAARALTVIPEFVRDTVELYTAMTGHCGALEVTISDDLNPAYLEVVEAHPG